MKTIVYNTKTHKVAFCFNKKPTNDELDAACEAVPNGFADEPGNLTIPELTKIFNANSGPDVNEIKKFANKTTAIERTTAALAEVPVYDGKTAPVSTTTTLSEGVAKSWLDPDVRERRSQRHGVKVDGTEFPSIEAAYREFKLDMKTHRKLRMELKACMPKKIKQHGKTWQAFER
jgi:hypothetical protein